MFELNTKKYLSVFCFLLIGCAYRHREYAVINALFEDKKYFSKEEFDVIAHSHKYLYIEELLEQYGKVLEGGKPRFDEFHFERGYNFKSVFTIEDIDFMKKTLKDKIKWKKKYILDSLVNIIKEPIFLSKEDEYRDLRDRILKNRGLFYLSRPIFNKTSKKAIIMTMSRCQNCPPTYYFLINKSNMWKIVGTYDFVLQ